MENRIKFALFLKGWSFDGGDKAYLKANAEKALTTEFEEEMHDNIYCPECCAPLFRSPEIKIIQTMVELHILLIKEA
ncbi:hypothetical protein ACNKTV_004700 [Vibrio parahaemolyticus]